MTTRQPDGGGGVESEGEQQAQRVHPPRQMLAWRRTLAPGGRMVGVAIGSLAGLGAIATSSAFGTRRIRTFAAEPPADYLHELTHFVDAHRIRRLVHEAFPLERVQEAHRAFAAPGLRGKIVVTMAP